MYALTHHTHTARAATQQACGRVHHLHHPPREIAEALHHLADTASAISLLLHHLRTHLDQLPPERVPTPTVATVLEVSLRPDLATAQHTATRLFQDLNICAGALDQITHHTSPLNPRFTL